MTSVLAVDQHPHIIWKRLTMKKTTRTMILIMLRSRWRNLRISRIQMMMRRWRRRCKVSTNETLLDVQFLLTVSPTTHHFALVVTETMKSEEPTVSITKRPEVIDDYIRNYLASKGLFKSLEAFQNEWYEFQQKGKLSPEDVTIVPDVYQKNQELADSLQKLRIDVENYKEIARTDFHRMHHKRVVQEKNRLIKHYEAYEPTLRQLRNQKMLTKLERDRLAGKLMALDAVGGKQAQPNNVTTVPTVASPHPPVKEGKRVVEKKEGKTAVDAQLPLEDRGILDRLKQIHVKMILATVSDDKTWKMWAFPSGELIMSGGGHKDWIADCDFHPRGAHLATASGDGTVKIWILGKGVWGCAFHDTGDFLASCSMDHTAKLWDITTGKCRQTAATPTLVAEIESLEMGPLPVNRLFFDASGSVLAAAGGDGTVKLYNCRDKTRSRDLSVHSDAVQTVCFDRGSQFLVTAGSDCTFRIFQ
ncbi:WD40-repeat-containing domain protein [Chytridium lagenaria]|nr:WD40-repeat-containing domain protein [Chytridium lagenaria]